MIELITPLTFYSPKILFGQNTFSAIPAEIKNFGDTVLVVTGKTAMRKAGITERLEQLLTQENITYYLLETVDPEPTIEHIEKILAFLRDHKVNLVIALGGGSVIDVAKAAAGIYGHISEEEITLREFIGHNITIPGIPCIAIPTTAGTGAEVTKNSVIIDKQAKIKRSIFRSPLMIPKVAIIDPILTVFMPPKITASSGMDALTQAIEAYVTRKANPFSEFLAIKAIEILGANLQKAVEDGSNIEIREKIAYGSLISGLAFANSSLGAVHGLAHPLGVLFNAPHGVVCAILLPYVMEFNKNEKTHKFAEIGRVLYQSKDISSKSYSKLIEFGIDFIRNLVKIVHLPTKLSEIGVTKEDIAIIVNDASGSSLNNNPRKAGPEELTKLLQNAL